MSWQEAGLVSGSPLGLLPLLGVGDASSLHQSLEWGMLLLYQLCLLNPCLLPTSLDTWKPSSPLPSLWLRHSHFEATVQLPYSKREVGHYRLPLLL